MANAWGDEESGNDWGDEEVDPNLGVGPQEVVAPRAGDAAVRAIGRGAWSLPAALTGGYLTHERAQALFQKLMGSDKSVADLTVAQNAASRASEAEYPWMTGILRGAAEAPGTALLPQAKAAQGASALSRAAASALTQGGQQFILGTATSVKDDPLARIAEGAVRAPIAATIGAVAPPVPRAPGPTPLELRAGKQTVRAHGGTSRDMDLLQTEFGEGAVGDEALAGLKVLETKGADGKPILPWLASRETLAARWAGVQDDAARDLARTKHLTDAAVPNGAVDTASVVQRMRTDALPVADNAVTRQAFGAEPGRAIAERIAAIEAEHASPIVGAPPTNQSLTQSEALKTALQRRALTTSSTRYQSKDPAAIRADPELQGLGALARVQKEAGEQAVENTLGRDALDEFVRAKERYGFADKMERLAHNAYNTGEAAVTQAPGSRAGVLRNLLSPPMELSHAPRARLYYTLAQAGKVVPSSGEVGAAATLTPALATPMTEGERFSAIQSWLKGPGTP
jgi:hypothetical protein